MNRKFYGMLSTIKNGKSSKKSYILQKNIRFLNFILNVLWKENIISGYNFCEISNNLTVFLKYSKKVSVIKNIVFISKPCKNRYFSLKSLWKFHYTNEIFIFSTRLGVLTLPECKKKKIGGELLCVIL